LAGTLRSRFSRTISAGIIQSGTRPQSNLGVVSLSGERKPELILQEEFSDDVASYATR
jgi:hypothetical protein